MNTNEHENNDQPVETPTEAACPECTARHERRAAREALWGEGRGDGRRRGPWGERPTADGPRPPFGPDAGEAPHPHRHGPHGPRGHRHGHRFGRKIRRAYERGFAAGFAQGFATRQAPDAEATTAAE